jgi:Flp pilus assembly protein TadG
VIGRLRSRAEGQSLTEFALVLPILMIVIFGVFDFSRAMFYLNSVSEAARNGSRIAMVNQDASYICETVAEQATILGLPTTCAADGTSPGVWLDPDPPCADIDCQQKVTVTAEFTPVIPIISGVVGPIQLRSDSTIHIERVCPAEGEATCPTTP